MPSKKKDRSRSILPCALTIAGSDSGGGAGIQADLKTFAAIGVHGTSAITCLTAQNPQEVRSVQPAETGMVRDQIGAILAELPPAAIKTGMLFSAHIIDTVVDALGNVTAPIIVDPVMIATSGAQLLKPDAVSALKEKLLSRATLATPNLAEAEFLLERKLRTPEDLRSAAREFHALYGCAALIKGGHLRGPQALDFFFDGDTELMLEAPRVSGVSTHGTGCTYSAAIAAYCALGRNVSEAVIAGKSFITNAIASSQKCGRHYVLNCFWERR